MENLDKVIEKLRALNEPVPTPLSLPSLQDVNSIETALGFKFPKDYKHYLLKGSDVVFGVIEPATIANPQSHTHLAEVIKSARDYGVPEELFPFCADNGDFYCFTPSGVVVFWSSDGPVNEQWPDLAVWIQDVWINASS